jgi:hypothetical protein
VRRPPQGLSGYGHPSEEGLVVEKPTNGGRPEGSGYEIRIKGRVADSFRIAFEDLTVTVNPVETVLCGVDLDQAALYGILERIQALGFELIEVRKLPPGSEET